ncbi:carbohydrate kinase [Rudanella paleaurantiibacter]|uniref:Carbohydrate kinase n=1 Tax=Rudanella paleaurantiibacter TaxID=2614655 RepID=A0A7J5TWE1_9BACT|nr:sugar kinase [Rudanella paleaurantiibacter]KAB7728743.1 carbohydrate kinase [Rudanella paleaurantiibacter]
MEKTIDILAVGELLADLIGQQMHNSLLDTPTFERFQGGSPANMAANMARLGNRAALVACVGSDNLGVYLVDEVGSAGVDTEYIARSTHDPTSIVLVSRSKGTPDFIAYRQADRQLMPYHLPDTLLTQARLFHTTCFALSQEPAQSTLVDAAARAGRVGCQVSIDCNYAPSIWPDREQAWQVIKAYCSAGALVKLSEDDAARLYGQPTGVDQIITDFHEMGATLVCLTLGAEGSLVSTNGGADRVQLPGRKIEVIDVTGAGDAYWAGFLTAWLDGRSPAACAEAGADVAVMKLTRKGPLPTGISI